MKKINEVEIDSNTFELINDLRCPRQLYRVNKKNQYALALLDRPNRIFMFKSEVLTELLNDLVDGVRDVTLIEPKEPEFGTRFEAGFEIRLYLEDDTFIGITQNDDVRSYTTTNYKGYIKNLSVVPVTELWDLPPDYPFDFLEMSLGLKKLIEPHVCKVGPSEVIYRLWSDYLATLRNQKIQPESGQTTRVHGEFGVFLVIEGSDRRVVLQHPN